MDVLQQINKLADEEHELYQRASHSTLSEPDHRRLRDLEVKLDQCWDLLHQRRARRHAGLDPNQAAVRDEQTVEGYVD